MKIIQPSKRSKRRSTSSAETKSSSTSERMSSATQLGDVVESPHTGSRQVGAKKTGSNSKRDRSSFDVSQGANSEGLLCSSDSAFKSKKKRRKSRYNKSLPRREGLDLENLDQKSAEKDSEFDFDASKLEAMPKSDQLEPAPHLEGKKRRRSELESTISDQPLELIVDPAKKEFNELFARGVRLLAMREHSVKEITNKLLDKSEASDAVYAVVDDLVEKKYLSDERFAENYVRARGNRGFGPVKIKAELKHKGVASDLIQDYLDEGAALWFDNALAQYQKKYGDSVISDYNAWTKRARFMQSRGFTMEHIHVTVPRVEFD